MKRKSTILSYFIVMLLTLVCCSKENDGLWSSSNADLHVSAFYAPTAAYQTRSVADSVQVETPADTLYIDDQTCMTTLVSDMVVDSTLTTRGTPIDSPHQLTSLNLVMFNTAAANYDEATSTATELFNITAKDGDFVLNESYAWTAGSQDKHTFIAIAPQTGANGIAIAADRKSLTYTVPTAAADHPDLCLSDISKNRDVVNTVGSNNHNQRFAMKHCLTAIGFEAVGYDLRITKITLKGASTTAVLNLTAGTWEALADVADCEPGINTGTWLMCNDNTQPVNITNANGYLMMIPQTFTDAHMLTMEYEGRNQQNGKGSYTVKLKDVGVAWTAGKKIIYQLRLKTKPAVENSALTIADPRGRYTTPLPLTISAAADDNLTFSWSEPWLRIHRGNPGYIASGGAPSGWSTGGNSWKNLYFFADTDNPSTAAARTATVTVTGKKSGKRTFTVTQDKMVALAMSPLAPGETIPTAGKTYTVGITSNTTWLGTEQSGATLSPASGNGNNSAVRIAVPQNSSWKDTPVKVAVSTTNSVGPILTRTWTGTQPGLPFTSTTTAIYIADHRAGSVADSAPAFSAAADDELTFTWNESWLKVYSGNRVNYVNTSIGSGSGFKATAAQWNKLRFFSTNDNPEPYYRVATVTVRSKSGKTHTFPVRQWGIEFSGLHDLQMDCTAGFSSKGFSIYSVAPNDRIEISGSGDLMPLLMDNPQDNVKVTIPTSQTIVVAGKDLGRVRFTSKTRNSDINQDRSMTATIKSQITGKTIDVSVIQEKDWSLTRSSERLTAPWGREGQYDFEISTNIGMSESRWTTSEKPKIEVIINAYGPSRNGWFDIGWIAGKNVVLNSPSTFTLKANIHPWQRHGTITYKVTYKQSAKEVTINVSQNGSEYWRIYTSYDLVKPPSPNPKFLVAREELGSKYYWGENWRCSNRWGDGWQLPSQEEFRMVLALLSLKYLYSDDLTNSMFVPFRVNEWHWTRDSSGWLRRYSIKYFYGYSDKAAGSAKEYNEIYRCVKVLY